MSKRKSITTPHDAYFKKALENPHTAKGMITCFLPKDVLGLLDLDSIEIQHVEFIDEELKKTASDVVFRVNTKQNETAYVYLLLEHQRNPHVMMPYRLLKYMVRLIDRHLKLLCLHLPRPASCIIFKRYSVTCVKQKTISSGKHCGMSFKNDYNQN